MVSTGALAPVAAGLGIGGELLLGKGEAASGGRDKPSILADALEALIGAVYLAHGLDRAREFVMGLLGAELASAAGAALGDAKNRLQELAVRIGEDAPRYRLREQGPDHDKRFSAEVYLGQRVLGRGTGRSKKQAERAAAEEAVAVLAEAEAPAGATAADGAPGGASPGDGPGAGERPSAASALS